MLFTPVYVVCLHVLFVPYWCLHVDAYNEVLYQLAVTQADILYCSPVDSLVNETPSWMDVAPWCYSWDGLGLDWIYLGGMRYWAPYGVSNFANRLVLQDNILQSSISINHLLLEIKSIVKCIATSGRGPCVYVLPADILLQSSQSCLCPATFSLALRAQKHKQLKCDHPQFPLFSFTFTFVRCLCLLGALVRGQHGAIAEWEYKQRSERSFANRAAA